MGTLKRMKNDKSTGMDGIVVEMLKNGDISLIDVLLNILNRCMESSVVPGHWNAAFLLTKRNVTEENVQIRGGKVY